jgi:hypothetical protein
MEECQHNWTYGDGIRWCEGCKVVEETDDGPAWTSDHWM